MLLALLAAGMAAQAIRFLQAAGVVTALHTRLWDTSWLLSDSSIAGRMLHVLVGYTDKPTGLQLLAYLATLATIVILMRLVRARAPAEASSLDRRSATTILRFAGVCPYPACHAGRGQSEDETPSGPLRPSARTTGSRLPAPSP